ncbi:MAG: hypothetical protein M0R66_03050 [Candidatus Omnitrophica bacterium]|jgi:hypothetical protein|nr:hypothetical protein [Candidatus Omnitrophota bacterium]
MTARVKYTIPRAMVDPIIAAVIIIIIIFVYLRHAPRAEPFALDLVQKVVPREQARAAFPNSVIIDSIPMQYDIPRDEREPDAPQQTAPIHLDEKPPITLTFDAAVARNALARSRDKRVFDAIANRTTDYYRPFYEEELAQCEGRDWWDDVAYPMNASGEICAQQESARPPAIAAAS